MSFSLPFANNLMSIDEFEQTYAIVQSQPIAEGKNGRVYLYRQKKTGNQVAIQKIQNIDRQTKFYILEEIRSAYSACQKAGYMQKIIDICQQTIERKGSLELYNIILIMEFGSSLLQISKQTGEISMAVLLNHFRRIATTLSIIHATKISHGNIKPQNIFQVEEKQQWSVTAANIEGKILRRVKFSGFLALKKGKVLPSPFSSPELFEYWGNRESIPGEIMQASDVYSLGVVMLCLVLQKNKVLEEKIDVQLLLDFLKVKVDQKEYTSEFLQLMREMTEIEYAKRPHIKAVLERIEFIKQKSLIPDMGDDEVNPLIDSMKYKKAASKN